MYATKIQACDVLNLPVAVVATSSLEAVSVATPPDIAAAASGVGLGPLRTLRSSLASLQQFFVLFFQSRMTCIFVEKRYHKKHEF